MRSLSSRRRALPAARRPRDRRLCLEVLEDRTVPTALVALTTGNQLLTFDSASPGTITRTAAVTGLQAGEQLLDIDARPANSLLYGLGSTGRIYIVNPFTGAATQTGPTLTLSGTKFAIDFNPTVDRLRVVSDAGQNLRVNVDAANSAGNPIVDLALAYGAGDPNFGKTPNVVGNAYTNNFAGATSTTLYDIDSTLDILAIQNPPNNGTLQTVGPLGVDTSSLVGFDIQTVGTTNTAFAALNVGGVSSLFTITLASGAATPAGAIGVGQQVRGLAALPTNVGLQRPPVVAIGAGEGADPRVLVVDPNTLQVVTSFLAFDVGFRGGVRVAVADVFGTGTPSIIAGAGPQADGVPLVRVFSQTGQIQAQFLAFDAGFHGGVFVAAGNLDADQAADIVVGADAGAFPLVSVFGGGTLAGRTQFLAFDAGFRGGVRVAVANLSGAAGTTGSILAGAGPQADGVPLVRVFGGLGQFQSQFLAFDAGFHGGVFVAAADLDGDRSAEIVAGAGQGGFPLVTVFSGNTLTSRGTFVAFDTVYSGGVRVAALPIDSLGRSAVLAVPGRNSIPQARTFDGIVLGRPLVAVAVPLPSPNGLFDAAG
jgi:hypothetical protein